VPRQRARSLSRARAKRLVRTAVVRRRGKTWTCPPSTHRLNLLPLSHLTWKLLRTLAGRLRWQRRNRGSPRMDFAQGFVPMRSLRSGPVHLAVTLALSAFTINGCGSTFAAESARGPARQVETISKSAIPEPDAALLRRQPEPACEFRGPFSDPVTPEQTRQKLDYEQQCYRGWEAIVRARLDRLQDFVRKMTESLPDAALLRRQTEPACAFRGPVSNPATAEETRQKLDYEQQCYRASEALVRARLSELQDSVQKMTKNRKTAASSRSCSGTSCPTPFRRLLLFLEHELAEFDSTARGIR
jgi:hypothetical protein